MKRFLVCDGCPWEGREVPGPLANAGGPAEARPSDPAGLQRERGLE